MKTAIGLCQLNPAHRSPEANVKWAVERCEEASKRGASLVLLPELFPFGPLASRKAAEEAAGRTPGFTALLQEGARQNGIVICAGLPWQAEDGGLFNCLFVIPPSGRLYRYEKLHLFAPFHETEVFHAGKGALNIWIDLPAGELGIGPMVCFDIRFPELARRLAGAGSHMLLVSALWPLSRKENFVTLLKARAMENQCFLAAANACGTCGGTEFAGSSLLARPDGTVSVQARDGEGLFISEIDTGRLSSLRNSFNSAWPRGEWNFQLREKLVSLPRLKEAARRKKASGQKMAFTNGCFDILHAGHVSYLRKARLLGDFLVVGLNSDSSIRRIKGPKRPVNTQEQRGLVLSALSFVDFVVLFDQDTPERLIRELGPDVLVKGADWEEDQIVGADFVKSRGGRVERIEFDINISTTRILKRAGNIKG